MAIKVNKGILQKPLKLVVYGPEGIGKTTFASQFPLPLFLDTEGGTAHMDVARFEAPKTWDAILEDVRSLISDTSGYQTFVLDTADWAVRLCESCVCMRAGKAGIEDFGYGKGYVYAKEEFAKLLDLMTELVDKGMNVVITAHSIIRKFERPDESGAYDRWEIKMGNKAGSQIGAICKEWADVVLFANYKETVVEINGKKKVQGGKRVMYTSHAPTWDAKNRHGMPPELPFDYMEIARIVPQMAAKGTKETTAEEAFGLTPATNRKAAEIEEAVREAKEKPQGPTPAKEPAPVQGTLAPPAEGKDTQPRDGVDPRILQLCDAGGILLDEVSKALQGMGISPGYVMVKDFPPNIVDELVAHWQEVRNHINEMRIPF